jgi:hypothetical protein
VKTRSACCPSGFYVSYSAPHDSSVSCAQTPILSARQLRNIPHRESRSSASHYGLTLFRIGCRKNWGRLALEEQRAPIRERSSAFVRRLLVPYTTPRFRPCNSARGVSTRLAMCNRPERQICRHARELQVEQHLTFWSFVGTGPTATALVRMPADTIPERFTESFPWLAKTPWSDC